MGPYSRLNETSQARPLTGYIVAFPFSLEILYEVTNSIWGWDMTQDGDSQLLVQCFIYRKGRRG